MKDSKKTLRDKLQIILITYNRRKYLARTFEQIFADNSPVRDFDITVLDNCSTDGTSELIEEYRGRFPNLKHIRHKRNIGGNANICRAFEIASREYLWVLCDDDEYDWKAFRKLADIIEGAEYDCFVVEYKVSNIKENNFPYIINSLAFLPAGIYKTKYITDDVMQNMETNILYSFPHLAIGCSLINNGSKFYISGTPIIKQRISSEKNITRGFRKEIHFRLANFDFCPAYINSYQLIINKKIRYKCCEVLSVNSSFYASANDFLSYKNKSFYDVCDVFLGVSLRQKLIFLFLLFSPVIFYVKKRWLYVRFFWRIKTKLIPFNLSWSDFYAKR